MVMIILFAGGLVMLVAGAHGLVSGASSLARRMGVSELAIGLTVVAFGTSCPELAVNAFACFQGKTDVALGNILGSNIFNILGILGIAALIYPLTVNSRLVKVEIPVSILAAVLIVALSGLALSGTSVRPLLSRFDGVIFLFCFAVFMVLVYSYAKRDYRLPELDIAAVPAARSVLVVLAGLALLVGGGKLLVYTAVNLARAWQLSERTIGLTIVAVGTSLPELATSAVAARRHKSDIAVGNVVGSNIFNILFILGISGLIADLPVSPQVLFDVAVLVIAGLAMLIFVFFGPGKKIDRWEALLLIGMYFVYLFLVITLYP